MKTFLAAFLALSMVACGARLTPAGTPSFQQKFVTNTQKTYTILTVVQALEHDQFTKGNISIEKHKVIATDIQVALMLTLDVEQVADALPEGKPAPPEVFALAKAVATIVDDVAQLRGAASPDLEKKVSAADLAFKVLSALFSNDGAIQL